MDFAEKLKRLTAGKRTEVGKRAGLPPNAISRYVYKKYVPRGDTALRIARVLGVTTDWLLDDTQEWPPPVAGRPSTATLDDDALMAEVSKRYRLEAIGLLKQLERMESVAWLQLGIEYLELAPGAPIPAEMDDLLAVAGPSEMLLEWTIYRYEPSVWATRHHQELPGSDLNPADLNPTALSQRLLRLLGPGSPLPLIAEWWKLRMIDTTKTKGITREIEERRAAILKALKREQERRSKWH